ncbi:MAG: CDP-diacylglycerol--glycerol-3-phosphate 3-phosphatidyltransferase [Nitrospinota bacterium]
MTQPAKVRDPEPPQASSLRPLFTPNKITLLRVLLAPVLVMLLLTPGLYNAPFAALVIALGSLTDWLDGHLARRWSAESDLGRLMDPIADKLILVTALIPLVASRQVPAWIAVLLIGREVAVTGLRGVGVNRGVVISAIPLAKFKTALQMAALILLVLDLRWGPLDFHLIGTVVLWAAMILSLASGLSYFRQFFRQVSLD